MTGNQIRETYLKFMKERGHAIVPSSALVPENDPTTLFTGSGMQPMLPYLLGEQHPKGTRVADSQKCFRAEDIDEIGDNRHTTFFEMLGNWSFGDYFKKEQIEWMYEFLTKEIGLRPEKLYITAFGGDENSGIPKDEESPRIWQELFEKDNIKAEIADVGTEENGYARGMKDGERIFYYDAKKNWWSRAGVPSNMPVGEPGGPDSEMFYDFGTEHDPKWGAHCHPNCDCGRFMEIGNNVFMQYIKTKDGSFVELENKNIDFGGGLERIVAAALHDKHGIDDVFKTDLLYPLIELTEKLSGKKYEENHMAFRVIADHIRGAVFMIDDGIYPGNTEQGYFVRRLIRRSVRYADVLGVPVGTFAQIADGVIDVFGEPYPSLKEKRDDIKNTIAKEEEQFRKTLEKGLKEFERYAAQGTIAGHDAFILFTTYGFPLELTLELAAERSLEVDQEGFVTEMQKHQEASRAGAEQKFKGGLADHSEKVVAYHTATHLLLAGLRHVLGDHVHQAGSNITGERLRFDFTHPAKVERDALDKVEAYVNAAIQAGGTVAVETMSKDAAEDDPTVEGSFWERYPDEVKVYTISGSDGTTFSRELCGGPHVEEISNMGTFKITKEEAVASGVRRVKAVLE